MPSGLLLLLFSFNVVACEGLRLARDWSNYLDFSSRRWVGMLVSWALEKAWCAQAGKGGAMFLID